MSLKNATAQPILDPQQAFKQAMASFPSGVTIVTTLDQAGAWRGFTATSFSSVSMDPPLVLVCLARTAECHEAFEDAGSFVIHIVGPEHAELATRFATRGAPKFAEATFLPDDRGNPVLDQAYVTLHCAKHATYDGGDHTILVGRVETTSQTSGAPTIYFQRKFHTLTPATG